MLAAQPKIMVKERNMHACMHTYIIHEYLEPGLSLDHKLRSYLAKAKSQVDTYPRITYWLINHPTADFLTCISDSHILAKWFSPPNHGPSGYKN